MAEILTTEELFKNAEPQVLTSEELFKQKPSIPTKIDQVVKHLGTETLKQLGDIESIPGRLIGINPPFQSEFATKPLDINIPTLTMTDFQSLLKGKPTYTIANINPTLLEATLNAGFIGSGMLGSIQNAVRYNSALRKQLSYPIIESILRARSKAIDIPFEDVTNVPVPKQLPATTLDIVTTQELAQIPGIAVSEPIQPPIVLPTLLQVAKAPIPETPAGITQVPVKPVIPRPKLPITFSEEDKGILEQIKKEVTGAQPGRRYVTRDEEGNVIGVGYEPSDYAYIPYWPEGWGKPELKLIENILKTGKGTQKQTEKIRNLLDTFKEVKDARARLESEVKAEGISQSEIDEAQRIGEEEAISIAETIHAEDLRKLSTDDLEKYVDSRYEAGAPQEELDLLETIFDERISEEDLSITEEELNVGEGIGVEEQLIAMYHRYLNRDPTTGLSIEGMMSVEDILSNMRSVVETAQFGAGKKEITDEQILSAAKDLYENKQKLLARQRAKEKAYPTNITSTGQIREELHPPLKKDLFQTTGITPVGKEIISSEELFGKKPTVDYKSAYGTPQWIDIWKDHPELQDQMLEYQRQQMEKEAPPGIQYAMEPGQAPQTTFEFYGPETGKVKPGRPVEGKYNVNDLLLRKDITVEQLVNELKRAAATHSKDIAGLQYVLQEAFSDLLPPRTEKATPTALKGIGVTGVIVDQAYLEMMGLGGDEQTLGYRYNPEGEISLDKWLRNNAFAAVTRTIMRFRVATRNPTDAALVAKYKEVEKMLTSKLVNPPTLKQIAIVAKFAKDPKKNLIKAMQIKDLIDFAEGKSSFEDSWMQMERAQERGGLKVTPPPQYSISEEQYNSVFNGGIGITDAEIRKPKIIAPVTATNEIITFPKEGGRHIAEIYEREIGPVLQMSKRMRKWLGVYYGGLGKGSGLIRVKSLPNLKVLAHETGHFLDDVLHKYPIEKGQRDELIRVAKYATPFEEKYIIGISPKTGKVTKRQDQYTAYRKSRAELFADYVSVYITDPAKCKELAPIFTSQVEREILQDKEFAYIVTKMREFNTEMQPIIDYVKDLEGIIPEIKPMLQSWAEKGNLFQNLWRNTIGDRVWNLLSNAVDTLGQRTLIGRILTEKKGLDNQTWEILRQRKHLIDGQTLKIVEELVQPISKMNKEDQEKVNAALQRFDLLASQEDKDVLTESARKELAIWGNEARKLGLLNEMAFFNMVGQYFPWMYETKEFNQNKATFGAWSQKNLRINLQSFKHRLSDEQMGRRALELKLGTWPSQKAKIEEYSKEELIAIGKKVREEMKLMKTVAYPLQKRLKMLINSVYTAKALNLVANIPGIIGHAGMEGYVQLAEGKSLGNLAGQYVPENLAREINSFNYKAEEIETAMETITGVWKTAKVPYNPAAMVRNAVTNMIQLWMTGDIPTWQPQVVISGVNSFVRRDATYKLLRDRGLYRHTYAAEELEKLAFLMETEPETNLQVIIKWAATIANSPSEFYGRVEDACKTVGAKWILQHSGSPEQAIKLADKCMFDYSSVSQMTGILRKWPLPFFTWSAKEFPRLVEAAIRKPEKMLFVLLLLTVGSAYARHKLGITKKQEESMKPEHLKGNWTLLLPYRDKDNQVQWVDFTYFMPWGGWLSPIKGSVVPQPLQIGNPMMTLYNAYVQNYDPYVGEIAKDWMTLDEQNQAKRNYVMQSLAPDISPWGRNFNNIIKSVTGKPNQYGQTSDLGKVLRGALLGIKTVIGGETTTAVTNWETEQKRAQIEVNRPAKLAWEAYYMDPTPENYQKAVAANKKVKIADRQRIKMKAKKDIQILKSKNPAWKKLSGPQKQKFRKYQRTLK